MNKWKELYIARMNLVEQCTKIVNSINIDILNVATTDLVDRMYKIPEIADMDFEFFQKAIDEYAISEEDSLALLLNYNRITLTWLLQSKEHYYDWKDISSNFIWGFLKLDDNKRQIVESYIFGYIRDNRYNRYVYSIEHIINAYIGDFTIKQFVEDNKHLVRKDSLSMDYKACLHDIIINSRYIVIRLDEDKIRVFKC